MKFLSKICLFTLALTAFTGCTRDDLNMEEFSSKVKLEREIAIPLIVGELRLEELMGEDADSVITIEGDTTFNDTLSIGDLFQDFDEIEIEFFDLYYKTKNYLPIGGDVFLVSYDSISNTHLDTIKFNKAGFFISVPPLDGDGNAIESQVVLDSGVVSVSKQTAENLINTATHIILEAVLVAEGTQVIPVDESKRIWVKFGVHAKGTIITDFDN